MERGSTGKWITARQKWWAPHTPRLQNGGEKRAEQGERTRQSQIYGKRKLEREIAGAAGGEYVMKERRAFNVCAASVERGERWVIFPCASTSTLLIHHSHLSLQEFQPLSALLIISSCPQQSPSYCHATLYHHRQHTFEELTTDMQRENKAHSCVINGNITVSRLHSQLSFILILLHKSGCCLWDYQNDWCHLGVLKYQWQPKICHNAFTPPLKTQGFIFKQWISTVTHWLWLFLSPDSIIYAVL